MLSRSEPREERVIVTNKIFTMFLNFCKSEPQRSYTHGSYEKKKDQERRKRKTTFYQGTKGQDLSKVGIKYL